MTQIINHLSTSRWSARITITLLFILSIGGIALIIYATEVGPWAYSDSAAYITTARNIAAGRGIVLQDPNNVYTLLPFHAPLFPIMLSLPISLGMDGLQASRWLNAILFGLTIFLAGWATFRFTRSFWISVGAAGLLLLSYEPILAFSGVMSEGLFIFWGFLSLILVATAIHRTNHQNRFLVFAGIAAGLAILSRYTGLALLTAGFLAIVVLVRGDIKVRFKKAVIFTIPAVILAALWLVPVYISTRTFGSRHVAEATGIADQIRLYFAAFMDVIGSWLPFYYRGNHIITPTQKLLAGIVLLIILFIIAARKIQKNNQRFNENGILTWGFVLFSFCIAYVGLHLATFITAVDKPDVNGRLLLPIFIAGVLLAAVSAAFISRSIPKTWIGGLVFAALAVTTVWYFHSKVEWYLFEMHHYGQGFTSKRWNENPIFENISSLDESIPLYSNDPALILFYTQRYPRDLGLDPVQKTYELDLPNGAALILIKGIAKRDIGETYDSYVQAAGIKYKIVFDDNEGVVFVPR